jgi:hypothetical protein
MLDRDSDADRYRKGEERRLANVQKDLLVP